MTIDEAVESLQSRGPGTYERRRKAEGLILAELERLREIEGLARVYATEADMGRLAAAETRLFELLGLEVPGE